MMRIIEFMIGRKFEFEYMMKINHDLNLIVLLQEQG